MTATLLTAFIVLACLYIAVNIALAIGVWTTPSCESTGSPLVSVIVAARNEEKHVEALTEHLARQDYPNYEVIIVNDRSTDSTGAILESLVSDFPRLRTITVTETPAGMPAKKHALEVGILESKGEILCFTDADCLPPETWVGSLVKCFDESTGLVAGYSPFSREAGSKMGSLLFSFLGYEELRAAAWSAGSIRWRLGWLCSGRNLAYRRKVWDDVGGYAKIKHSISGDDDLFLQTVRRRTPWKIRYVKSADSHVPTMPVSSFAEFINQRTRHFSAGKYFTAPMKAFFGAYHGINFLLYLGLVAGIVFSVPALVWAFIDKAASDMFLMLSAQRIDKKPNFVLASPFLEFLYLCYNVIVGPLGMMGSFRWKP